MTSQWIAFSRAQDRQLVEGAHAHMKASTPLFYARSASELRTLIHDEEPRAVGVIVGPCPAGVSEMNLAAAIAHDGNASEVVLVVADASGSLRSRAMRAGISRVLDAGVLAELPVVPELPVMPELREGAANGESTGGASSKDEPSSAGRREERMPSNEREAVGDASLSAPWPNEADEVPVPTPSSGGHDHDPAAPRMGMGAPQEEGGSVITLVSGRGGVGKTTICALMGAIAASWGLRVALVDLDLSCGNLGSCFAVERVHDLARLARSEQADLSHVIDSCGSDCASGITLWGPCERPEHAETVMPLATPLIRHLRTTHDLVLVDCSTTCTDAVAQAMQATDRLVCVYGSGGGGIASLSRTSALAVRLGVARTRIVRVEARCEPRAWGKPFDPCVEIGLETARAYRVVEGEPDVMELISSGGTSDLSSLEEDLSRSVATLLASLLKELGNLPHVEMAERAASGGLVRRAFPLFGRRREAV